MALFSGGAAMRVLTVKQPWASLIVLGHKTIENRHYAIGYRGDVAILASRKVDRSPLARAALEHWRVSIPTGGILGVVELFDTIRSPEALEPGHQRWWIGPVGWLLRNARETPFIPATGTQGIHHATLELETEIRSYIEPLRQEAEHGEANTDQSNLS